MNRVQQLFLNLISSALTGTRLDIVANNAELELLEKIAVVNKCLSLIYQGCANSGIQPPIHWKHNASFVVMDSHRKLAVENELINILANNGIRACILKGSSVAMNYPNPLARSMGDIDILVDECNYEKAALLFVNESDFIANKHDFHLSFDYKNIVVELHRQVTRYNSGDKYRALLIDCMDNIQARTCDEFEVPVLSNKHQAISLLSHMIRHFSENKFVFRMYCDWVCFVNSISLDSWNSEVYPYIKDAGLSLFADALNKSAMMFLGIDTQTKVVNNIDDATCHILIEEFVSADKSATADGMDVNLGTVFSHHGIGKKNIFLVYISSVNYIVKHKYSLGRFVFLRPMFWIWLPIKYIFNVIIGRRKRLDFQKIRDITKRREILFNSLKLTANRKTN